MKRLLAALLLSLAASLPAGAQPAAVPLIGFLGAASPEAYADRLASIREGLKEAGFVEGQNVTIEYRWAHGRYERLPALAAELVHGHVAVIITSGGSPAALAARGATATIPIVFGTGGDPVKEGLVTSLNRPGGNATGISVLTETLAAKRLEIFREMVPGAEVIGLLVNPGSTPGLEQLRDTEEASRALGQRIHVLKASSEADLEPAFAAVAGMRIRALLVAAEPMFNARREQIVALAQRHAVPAIYPRREFVAAGGLMSYGTRLAEAYRQQGVYAGRILKGARPADLPVVQPTRFELVVNLRAAKTLGLAIPQSLLLQADEVME